jgi:uncharacterized protein (TIGR02246 family)
MTPIDQTTGPMMVATTMFELMEQAWNRADGPAFGALFDDETDFVNIHGAHLRGDGAFIARGHQVLFDGIYAGSTVRYQVDVAREVSPGCVVAVVAANLDAPSGPLQGINKARITVTIIERESRWSITAFQNTLVEWPT